MILGVGVMLESWLTQAQHDIFVEILEPILQPANADFIFFWQVIHYVFALLGF